MNNFLKISQSRTKTQPITYLLSILLGCLLLLSACGSSQSANMGQSPSTNLPMDTSSPTAMLSPTATATPSPTPTPVPTVSATSKQQGNAQLQVFQGQIHTMQQYGGNITIYQQQYTNDQLALSNATTPATYQQALDTLNGHINAIKLPILQSQAHMLQQQLANGAAAWGQQHTYFDSYNGTTYNLGYEYTAMGGWGQDEIASSQTLAQYQQTVDDINMWAFNFQAYKDNFSDSTPYNQVHQTDTRILQHYGYTSGNVIVVSLNEQAMRIYQNGQLVRAFLVVTGKPGHPSLPGTWWVESKLTNTHFTSGKLPGQEDYYPPTPIPFALGYHSGGYFLHTSWWRTLYGRHMEFPHLDAQGTPFAYDGSHGCINMSNVDISWLYTFSSISSTKIVIY